MNSQNRLLLTLTIFSICITYIVCDFQVYYLNEGKTCTEVEQNTCYHCNSLYYIVNCTSGVCHQYVSPYSNCTQSSPAEVIENGSCSDLTSSSTICSVRYKEEHHTFMWIIIIIVAVVVIAGVAAAIAFFIYKKKKESAYETL